MTFGMSVDPILVTRNASAASSGTLPTLDTCLRNFGMLAEPGEAVVQWMKECRYAEEQAARKRADPMPSLCTAPRIKINSSRFACEECGAMFSLKKTLNMHLRQHEADRLVEEDEDDDNCMSAMPHDLPKNLQERGQRIQCPSQGMPEPTVATAGEGTEVGIQKVVSKKGRRWNASSQFRGGTSSSTMKCAQEPTQVVPKSKDGASGSNTNRRSTKTVLAETQPAAAEYSHNAASTPRLHTLEKTLVDLLFGCEMLS